MTPLLATLLITHVIGGLIAIGMHNVMVMHLFKQTPNYSFLVKLAWSSFTLYLLSWSTSAYYYVTYYGTAVKPRILASDTPWAHLFFMETKEHVFLILPFIALSIALATTYLRNNPDDGLRKATAFLTIVAFVIGIATAAMGVIVSGSI